MKLLVGLGNPGSKYANNRHNIGFMALDRIADDHGFAPWRSKFQGQLSEGRLGSGKVVLLKPETFMNNSGQSVGEAMRFFKLAPEDIIVLHDEIDLAPGKVRYKTGGGHAGHNGLRSIMQHVGTTDFVRLRIGVGKPPPSQAGRDYVLRRPGKVEAEALAQSLEAAADAVELFIAEGIDVAMNQVNRRPS